MYLFFGIFFFSFSILDYKLQHTLKSLECQKEALQNYNFSCGKHWARTNNYEDFVRFIGEDLQDQVLSECLKYSHKQKNETYLSVNSVVQFIEVISDWMKASTINAIKQYEHFTLLLEESRDESNRSELSLIARRVKEGVIQNHFLDLLQLCRCHTNSIFETVHGFLQQENIDIIHIHFAGMDGSSTMSGEHKGVRTYFERISPHFVYIHCRNHCLTLCFAHLIPCYDDFSKFGGLLLNLYLLLKSVSVKQSIFKEVQNSYD